MFATIHSDLLNYHVIEKVFAAEREILQDHHIAKIVSRCLRMLGNKIPLSVPFSRIRYDKFSRLAEEVARFVVGSGGNGEFAELKLNADSSSTPPTGDNSWLFMGFPSYGIITRTSTVCMLTV